MPWLMACLGVVATALNANQIVYCFVLYMITNVYWTYHNMRIKEYAQASLCCIYLVLAMWGLYVWK